MPYGGRITLSTANVHAGGADFVRFAVRDTGVGIDSQTRSRLFEPFYTTKGPGKGTGLGLATVYGIVKQAGGQVRVESEPGHGALFEVLLPRSTTSATARAPEAEPVAPPRGRGTILLVEDDESVRDFVGFVLRQQGYEVFDAEHGPRALEIARGYDGEIDLMISDVVMPHMDGFAVADALRRSRPSLRVLHISGYPGDSVTGDAAFLAKPFSRETLLERVAELIARRA
jgi:CheY-like chemotaxis protein